MTATNFPTVSDNSGLPLAEPKKNKGQIGPDGKPVEQTEHGLPASVGNLTVPTSSTSSQRPLPIAPSSLREIGEKELSLPTKELKKLLETMKTERKACEAGQRILAPGKDLRATIEKIDKNIQKIGEKIERNQILYARQKNNSQKVTDDVLRVLSENPVGQEGLDALRQILSLASSLYKEPNLDKEIQKSVEEDLHNVFSSDWAKEVLQEAESSSGRSIIDIYKEWQIHPKVFVRNTAQQISEQAYTILMESPTGEEGVDALKRLLFLASSVYDDPNLDKDIKNSVEQDVQSVFNSDWARPFKSQISMDGLRQEVRDCLNKEGSAFKEIEEESTASMEDQILSLAESIQSESDVQKRSVGEVLESLQLNPKILSLMKENEKIPQQIRDGAKACIEKATEIVSTPPVPTTEAPSAPTTQTLITIESLVKGLKDNPRQKFAMKDGKLQLVPRRGVSLAGTVGKTEESENGVIAMLQLMQRASGPDSSERLLLSLKELVKNDWFQAVLGRSPEVKNTFIATVDMLATNKENSIEDLKEIQKALQSNSEIASRLGELKAEGALENAVNGKYDGINFLSLPELKIFYKKFEGKSPSDEQVIKNKGNIEKAWKNAVIRHVGNSKSNPKPENEVVEMLQLMQFASGSDSSERLLLSLKELVKNDWFRAVLEESKLAKNLFVATLDLLKSPEKIYIQELESIRETLKANPAVANILDGLIEEAKKMWAKESEKVKESSVAGKYDNIDTLSLSMLNEFFEAFCVQSKLTPEQKVGRESAWKNAVMKLVEDDSRVPKSENGVVELLILMHRASGPDSNGCLSACLKKFVANEWFQNVLERSSYVRSQFLETVNKVMTPKRDHIEDLGDIHKILQSNPEIANRMDAFVTEAKLELKVMEVLDKFIKEGAEKYDEIKKLSLKELKMFYTKIQEKELSESEKKLCEQAWKKAMLIHQIKTSLKDPKNRMICAAGLLSFVREKDSVDTALVLQTIMEVESKEVSENKEDYNAFLQEFSSFNEPWIDQAPEAMKRRWDEFLQKKQIKIDSSRQQVARIRQETISCSDLIKNSHSLSEGETYKEAVEKMAESLFQSSAEEVCSLDPSILIWGDLNNVDSKVPLFKLYQDRIATNTAFTRFFTESILNASTPKESIRTCRFLADVAEKCREKGDWQSYQLIGFVLNSSSITGIVNHTEGIRIDNEIRGKEGSLLEKIKTIQAMSEKNYSNYRKARKQERPFILSIPLMTVDIKADFDNNEGISGDQRVNLIGSEIVQLKSEQKRLQENSRKGSRVVFDEKWRDKGPVTKEEQEIWEEKSRGLFPRLGQRDGGKRLEGNVRIDHDTYQIYIDLTSLSIDERTQFQEQFGGQEYFTSVIRKNLPKDSSSPSSVYVNPDRKFAQAKGPAPTAEGAIRQVKIVIKKKEAPFSQEKSFSSVQGETRPPLSTGSTMGPQSQRTAGLSKTESVPSTEGRNSLRRQSLPAPRQEPSVSAPTPAKPFSVHTNAGSFVDSLSLNKSSLKQSPPDFSTSTVNWRELSEQILSLGANEKLVLGKDGLKKTSLSSQKNEALAAKYILDKIMSEPISDQPQRKAVLLALGQSGWFQNLLTKDPKIGDMFFNAAEKLFPKPKGADFPFLTKLNVCVQKSEQAYKKFTLYRMKKAMELASEISGKFTNFVALHGLFIDMEADDDVQIRVYQELMKVFDVNTSTPETIKALFDDISQLAQKNQGNSEVTKLFNQAKCQLVNFAIVHTDVKAKETIQDLCAQMLKDSKKDDFHFALDTMFRYADLPKNENSRKLLKEFGESKKVRILTEEHPELGLPLVSLATKFGSLATEPSKPTSVAIQPPEILSGNQSADEMLNTVSTKGVESEEYKKVVQDFSKDLFGMSAAFFQTIQPKDLAQPAEFSKVTSLATGHFNRLSGYVVSSIVDSSSLQNAHKRIQFWLNVAEESLARGDQNSAMAIYAALQKKQVYELYKKGNIDKQIQEQLTLLEKELKLEPGKRFQKLYEYTQNRVTKKQLVIPYLGSYASYAVAAHEGGFRFLEQFSDQLQRCLHLLSNTKNPQVTSLYSEIQTCPQQTEQGLDEKMNKLLR